MSFDFVSSFHCPTVHKISNNDGFRLFNTTILAISCSSAFSSKIYLQDVNFLMMKLYACSVRSQVLLNSE